MTTPESEGRLEELIQGYLEGTLGPKEAEALLACARADETVVRRLLEELRTDLLIQETLHAVEEATQAGNGDLSRRLTELLTSSRDQPPPQGSTEPVDEEEVRRIKRYAESQLQSFLAEQDEARQEQERIERARLHRQARRRRFRWDLVRAGRRLDRFIQRTTRAVVGAAVCMAAVLVLVVLVQHFIFAQRIVATLGESKDARWSESPATPELRPGWLSLEEGFAKLRFTSGAEVIVQAPTSFELKSPKRLVLEAGTVTAKVPPSAIGFKIDTPTSSIKDFGTEFGVAVNNNSRAEVHVFEGRVRLTSTVKSRLSREERDLRKGQMATATAGGKVQVGLLRRRPNLFVRDLPSSARRFGIPGKTVDLADIVGGGNGFGTGTPGLGIDPSSGLLREEPSHGNRPGSPLYQATPALPFIDGVFVPSATGGWQRVSSASHLYEFPPCSGGWWVEIVDGGVVNMEKSDPDPPVLAGQPFGTDASPAISMHANAGITFDLEAIRGTLAQTQIVGFSALCGISNNVPQDKGADAVFYVLVDGQPRFQKGIRLAQSQAESIHVGLSDGDGFLTLVCTEGSANSGDWSLFGRPVLELSSR